MKKISFTIAILLGMSLSAWAQFPPRQDDHFWRRKVMNRIDLDEKVNKALVGQESKYYRTERTDTGFGEKEGIVYAIFNDMRRGEYSAYDPDTLTRSLTWEQVIDKINEINNEVEQDLTDYSGGMDDDIGGFDPMLDEDDPFGSDFNDLGDDDMWDTGNGNFDEATATSSEAGAADIDMVAAVDRPLGNEFGAGQMPDLLPFNRVLHFVEDRIFDKNRSAMVYDIQYVEIIWVDPNEVLPERVLCVFRYEDIMPTLEKTQWKNQYNDAEYRNMREIFEFRLFHSYIIDISGRGITTLDEAEYRRHQLVEFEHHLWSY